eukprot:TRINITY_DN19013_c2_g1_i2.p1 TRINITY_DN19013_c2_g1~~TRINITY_DN19013_c2_g1_i2.p1  ORF type:complete len:388 (+),score=74.04 TRINITY_DN19013_c2_g1_i2:84-1166(+)
MAAPEGYPLAVGPAGATAGGAVPVAAPVVNPYAAGPPPAGATPAGATPVNPYAAGPPPALPVARPADAGRHERLQQVLRRFEISIAEAQDLVVLQDYDIVIIADDSGSMRVSSLPHHMRPLPGSGQPDPSRWEELKATVAMVIEIATVFDDDGIDLYFLNRPPIKKIASVDDPRLAEAFCQPPAGRTPLTQCLRHVVAETEGEKPTLLVIATDGVPDSGPADFIHTVDDIVSQRITRKRFRFQLMACTADDDAVGWMNQLDQRFKEVDTTDDYYSERAEVLKAGRLQQFTRSDWVIKALLGPVSQKFDAWDEASPRMGGGQGRRTSGGGAQRVGGGGGGGGGGARPPGRSNKSDECCTVL